jgi:integrase
MLRLKRERNSPYWYIRGTVKGVRIYESTGTAERDRAEEFKVNRERELYDAKALNRKKPATWGEAINAWLDAGRSYRYLKKLTDHFGDKPLPEIDQLAADAAVRKLYPKASPATIRRQCHGRISAVIRYANEIEMPGAPLRRFRSPPVPKNQLKKWASDEYIEKLLAHCPPDVRAAIMVMTYTGLRTGEVIGLTREAFVIRPGWVLVETTKNGDPAFVPLTTETHQAVLAVLPDEGPAFRYQTTQGLGKAIKRAAKAAGLPYMRGHVIGRHSFAARILAKGYDLKTLKEAGRWKKLQVVDEIYGHLEGSRVHDAILNAAKKSGK